MRATCALPPCAATVVVRSTGAKPRIVGSVKFSIPGLGGATQSLTLLNWARTLAGRKQGLPVALDLGLRSGDGSGERLSANVKLRS